MTAPLLVVAHEGYRNGATLVLRNLLPHLEAEVGRPIRVEVTSGGPMAAELRGLTTAEGFDAPAVVLVNSALAADRRVDLAGIPSVIYVHEVGEALERLSPAALEGLVQADRLLCVSERSRADLLGLGVRDDRVAVLAPPIVARPPSAAAARRARAELGAGPGERLVVACGEAAWRKGADLFVDLARTSADPGVRWAWIGRRSRAFARLLDHDTHLAGLEDRLTWFGEVPDALPHLAAADLVVVPSREDPQPLVALEAAVAGTAAVGFASTGMADLAALDAAGAVPYPDVAALADLVVRLLDDEPARHASVERARRIVAHERSLETVAARVGEALRAVVHPSPPTSAPPESP